KGTTRASARSCGAVRFGRPPTSQAVAPAHPSRSSASTSNSSRRHTDRPKAAYGVRAILPRPEGRGLPRPAPAAPLGQAGFRQAQAVAEGLHQVLEGPRGFHHLQALLETAAKVLARPLANHLEGDLLLGDQFALGDIQNDLVLLASRHGFLANQAQPSQRNVRSIAQRQVAGRVTHIDSHPFDKRKTAELTHFFGSSRSWKNIMANRPDP